MGKMVEEGGGRLGGWRLPRNLMRGVRFAACRMSVSLIFAVAQ